VRGSSKIKYIVSALVVVLGASLVVGISFINNSNKQEKTITQHLSEKQEKQKVNTAKKYSEIQTASIISQSQRDEVFESKAEPINVSNQSKISAKENNNATISSHENNIVLNEEKFVTENTNTTIENNELAKEITQKMIETNQIQENE